MIKKSGSHCSFAILELMLSLSILLILSSIAIPTFFNNTSHQLTRELNQLFMLFSYLQKKAMASGQTKKMIFNIKENSYRFASINNQPTIHKLNQSLSFGFLSKAKGPPGDPSKIITKPITFSNKQTIPTAFFLADGKISPGTIYIVSKNKKHMGALTSSLSDIAFLRKYLYVNQKWILS